MLNPELKKVSEMLQAGQEPTMNDLGQALAATVRERDFYQSTLGDMAGWMSRLVTAHMKQDAIGVKSILDEFIAKHVKVAFQASEARH